MKQILTELAEIKKLINSQNVLHKEILTLNEAADFLQVSHSHIYKLTCNGVVPCYCPTGKKLYFKRGELEDWLLRNRQAAQNEIEIQSAAYVNTNKVRKIKNPKI